MAKKQEIKVERGSIRDIFASIKNALDIEVYEVAPDEEIEFIPTPFMWVNNTAGGFAKGRLTFLNGEESSGKTTFVLQTIAKNQAANPNFTALFIDAEQAFNIKYAKQLGCDLDRLHIVQLVDIDEIFEIIRTACCEVGSYNKGAMEKNKYTRNFDLICVDSIDAMLVKEDINNESIVKNRMGLKAVAMGNGIKKITTPVNFSKTAVVFINQFRDNISGYGASKVVGGGNAQKFYATLRLDFKTGIAIATSDKKKIGSEVNVTIYKNKVGTPKGERIFKLYYGKGFNTLAEVLDEAIIKGIVKKAGAWFSIPDGALEGVGEIKVGQGELGALDFLDSNPELVELIVEKLNK